MLADEREQKTHPFDWGRIQEEAQIVARCEQLGGKLLNQSKPNDRRPRAGFQCDQEEE